VEVASEIDQWLAAILCQITGAATRSCVLPVSAAEREIAISGPVRPWQGDAPFFEYLDLIF
jgi:hypothetical protein